MAAGLVLTAEEYAALDGQPCAVRWLYVVIRKRMDFSTGLAGAKAGAGISWQAFREELYVDPGRGIVDSGAPSKTAVRRMAERLANAGLIRNESKGKRLVIRCLMAAVDQGSGPGGHSSAQNKPGTNPAQTRHTDHDTRTETNPGTADQATVSMRGIALPVATGNELGTGNHKQPGTNPAHHEPEKPGTPPLSVIRSGSSSSSEYSPRTHVDPVSPETNTQSQTDPAPLFAVFADLARQYGAKVDFRQEAVRGVRSVPMIRAWAADGVTQKDVREVVAIVVSRPDCPVFRPEYLAGAMADYRAGVSRHSGQTKAGKGLHGGAAHAPRIAEYDPDREHAEARAEEARLFKLGESLGIVRADGETDNVYIARVQEGARARKRDQAPRKRSGPVAVGSMLRGALGDGK